MKLFEQLRREYEFGLGTIRSVARKFGVHHRLVQEAAAQALPPEGKRPQRARPRLAPLIQFKCPTCGETIWGALAYCPKCGEPLNRKCPGCGGTWRYIYTDDYEFCPSYGTRVKPATASG